VARVWKQSNNRAGEANRKRRKSFVEGTEREETRAPQRSFSRRRSSRA